MKHPYFEEFPIEILLASILLNFLILTSLSAQPTVFVASNNACDGMCNASASVTVMGGVPPYTFNWSNGNYGQSIDQVCAGEYSVVVTDSEGSSITQTVAIESSSAIQIGGGILNATCSEGCNGSITPTVSGGVEPYSFSWLDGSGEEAREQLCLGQYTVVVTDQNGCKGSLLYEVGSDEIDILQTTGVQSNTCVGGATGLVEPEISEGAAPFGFAWVGPNGFEATSSQITGLKSGLYYLEVTDANGCVDSQFWEVEEEIQPILSGNCAIGNTCIDEADGWLIPEITAGQEPFSYGWTGPNGFVGHTKTIHDLTAGDYTIEVTDDRGCTDNGTWNVEGLICGEPELVDLTLEKGNMSLNLFPNPVHTNLLVDVEGADLEKSTIQVIDIQGRFLEVPTNIVSPLRSEIDMSALPN
ncbi:MAG: hypothetical protein HKN32_05285 [Flavobacteriales bacterium]|nr:hypothetical protein [Flavobacteriales bacterium]